MENKVTGVIEAIFSEEQVTDKFKKRDFVINTGGDYPQSLKFQMTQDRTGVLNDYQVGDAVDVRYNLKGAKSEKGGIVRYFVNLEAWGVYKSIPENTQPVSPEKASTVNDDLPF
jgi:hypothetical protein